MSLPVLPPDPPQDYRLGWGRIRDFAPGELKDLIGHAVQRARDECAANRALIFAHEDLTNMLGMPPLKIASPREWTGYVPPEIWDQRINNAPERRALVALLDEARRRQQP